MEPSRLHRLPRDQISIGELRTGYSYIDACLAKTYPDWKTKTSWSSLPANKENLTEIACKHFHISNESFEGNGWSRFISFVGTDCSGPRIRDVVFSILMDDELVGSPTSLSLDVRAKCLSLANRANFHLAREKLSAWKSFWGNLEMASVLTLQVCPVSILSDSNLSAIIPGDGSDLREEITSLEGLHHMNFDCSSVVEGTKEVVGTVLDAAKQLPHLQLYDINFGVLNAPNDEVFKLFLNHFKERIAQQFSIGEIMLSGYRIKMEQVQALVDVLNDCKQPCKLGIRNWIRGQAFEKQRVLDMEAQCGKMPVDKSKTIVSIYQVV